MLKSIATGTAIAVTNAGDNVRVYAQDTDLNIRQSVFQDGVWSGGNTSDVVVVAKQRSPLAACSGNGMGRVCFFVV